MGATGVPLIYRAVLGTPIFPSTTDGAAITTSNETRAWCGRFDKRRPMIAARAIGPARALSVPRPDCHQRKGPFARLGKQPRVSTTVLLGAAACRAALRPSEDTMTCLRQNVVLKVKDGKNVWVVSAARANALEASEYPSELQLSCPLQGRRSLPRHHSSIPCRASRCVILLGDVAP